MDFLTKEFIYQKSSQEITSLLYEAFITNVQDAIEDINNTRFLDSNKKLQKANDILERLGVGLNYEAGIMADQLDALYNYMADKIIQANLRKDVSLLVEALDIAKELQSAWNTALKSKPKVIVRSRHTNAYEKQVAVMDYEPNTFEKGN